ncbi:MAG TPA: alanine--glyoxylate aminotransferase family protein [Anaerolineae bacterium]|nr:alanine--glyoxylate aminotransferase family protein [Anaerolineae bacterium]
MPRPLLMIPGPVEVDAAVLSALAQPPLGHTSATFIDLFGGCLDSLREVFRAPDGQPFVVAGSGTLAMELAVANVIEPGDRAVVVDTGYFARRMVDVLKRHGANVEAIPAPAGDCPTLEQVESALRAGAKVLSITHVDTSTGVVAPVAELAALARRYTALTLVDGVCALGGEEFEMQAWDVDVCLTASQKALATPIGLAIVMARPRALEAFNTRRRPVGSYYCDWNQWLPIMRAYQARKPAYFATPPTNLIAAFGEAVRQLCAEGLEARWARQRRLGAALRAALQTFGLRLVPTRSELAADTLSVAYYPAGIDDAFVGRVGQHGVAIAGGLHPDIRGRYFRVGHMGIAGADEIRRTVTALEAALIDSGYPVEPGAGVAAAQAV